MNEPVKKKVYKTNWECSCGVNHKRQDKCEACGEESGYQVTRLNPRLYVPAK